MKDKIFMVVFVLVLGSSWTTALVVVDKYTKPYIEKYLKGVDHVPTEHRMRMFKLIEHFTYGQGATYSRAEAMHGAGAPEMQKVFIRRMYDFESLKTLARMPCGIEEMDYSK